MKSRTCALTLSTICSVLLASSVTAAEPAGEPGRSSGKPNPLNNVYFGEQHLHTELSADAYAFGTRNTQEDAYRYAMGLPVKKNTSGKMVKKKTPYDWVAVTDHAEYIGTFPQLTDKNSELVKKQGNTPLVKMILSGDPQKAKQAFAKLTLSLAKNQPNPAFDDPELIRSIWKKYVETNNKFYKPGKFTTLVAFEWTSMPASQNLHRNVFFRDDGPVIPFSAFDSDRPEDLWTYIETQRRMGHPSFAIPHNGNLSNGIMFAPRQSNGLPIDARYAKRRAANEIATEIIQTKGQSDTNPVLSPNDEFAGFEEQYRHMIAMSDPQVVARVDYSYVRQALINGVGYQEALGVNPFKLGIVAGGDSHTAFSVNEEFNFTGVHGLLDDTPKKRLSGIVEAVGEPAINFGTTGTTAVWAPENTREAIFDGIQRKETYGTSGTLMRVRFFGGWNYPGNLDRDKDFVSKAYQGGVPMGGDLPKKPAKAKAPTFVVWARKDPDSGNLDRIQIIKGWYEKGYPHEKIYDVALSDHRKPDPRTGKVPPVGNTVNIREATYSNDIGDTRLSATWTDPDFNPALHAFYYVRVLEIPTPRWSTYDAKAMGVEPPASVPATIQERAWTSPIWYTPDPKLVKKAPYYPNLHQVFN